jgi:hypothetical protein
MTFLKRALKFHCKVNRFDDLPFILTEEELVPSRHTGIDHAVKAVMARRSKPTVRRPGHRSSRIVPRSGKSVRPKQ